MKTVSLLKAMLSQDMNIFKYSTKKNSNKITKLLFPAFLFICVFFSALAYAWMISEKLYEVNLTYITLTIFIFSVSILIFMEGIYKSQGILFEALDNDLLFSLPVPRKKILFARIFKLLFFQYIYDLMFVLPAFICYSLLEHPNFNFYFISFIMTFLIPIIPTILSSILGYIVKLLASKSKYKKIIQTLLSSIIFIVIFFISLNTNSLINSIIGKASSINEILIKIYYPIGLYVNLINKFNIIEFIKLLLVNIVPFVLFIILGSKLYFKIIFNFQGSFVRQKKYSKRNIFKQKKPITSLVSKELRRYFSSPVYMFNTSFGLILVVAISIILVIKGKDVFNYILQSYQINTNISIYVCFYFLILFSTAMTSISSSSISLEKETINITKCLPIKEELILKSKILSCFIIELPFLLLGELIFFFYFKPNIFYIVSIFLIGFVVILLSAIIGLIVNLKYPKMNASNDTEVVKQSISSMISIFIGMGLFVISIIGFVYLSKIFSIEKYIVLHLVILSIINLILYYILINYSVKDYRKIDV